MRVLNKLDMPYSGKLFLCVSFYKKENNPSGNSCIILTNAFVFMTGVISQKEVQSTTIMEYMYKIDVFWQWSRCIHITVNANFIISNLLIN